MKIVADENLIYVREAFGDLGTVRLIAGRDATPAGVKDADILLVRSVTKVDERLLNGSNVKMVATATIGKDHLDEAYLSKAGITVASAAGSNANSVAEYVVAALLTLARRNGFRLSDKVIGVIGVGNVGSKVAAKCSALGMTVLKNDPPLKELTGSDEYVELDDVLQRSDIITLHVPLTVSGRWPTRHMVDSRFWQRAHQTKLLINTSRGAVVDSAGLSKQLSSGALQAVLDVWENEPAIDTGLLTKVALGTAHIAGYSFDGKVNGTEMIYRAVCQFLGVTPSWDPRLIMPAPPVPVLTVDPKQAHGDELLLLRTIRRVYDIESDDRRLREMTTLSADAQARHFDYLRRHYPIRREFFNTRIEFASPPSQRLLSKLSGLGFNVPTNTNAYLGATNPSSDCA